MARTALACWQEVVHHVAPRVPLRKAIPNFYPRYAGGDGWVAILLHQIADDALESHLRAARRIIASKQKPARKPRGV